MSQVKTSRKDARRLANAALTQVSFVLAFASASRREAVASLRSLLASRRERRGI